MYNDDWTMPPADEGAMWSSFEDILDALRMDLKLPLESAEDALTDELHIQDDGSVNRNTLGVIRYRGISEENDQREYFLEMGRGLLSAVRMDIEARRMTPQFVQRWGQLLFCHGYIVSHIMDDGDHVAADRARHLGNRSKVTRSAQRKTFIARVLLRLMRGGAGRKLADHRAAEAIADFMSRASASLSEAERSWWADLLADWPIAPGSEPRLASALRQKHFADQQLESHASVAMAGLPDLDILFPNT